MDNTVDNVIEMRHIVKQFGNFRANDDINLTLKKGEILALLGENGAGKSTLMNILSGLLQPTSGDIYVNGKKVIIKDPNTAKRLKIGMVHQHFMLAESFSVLENIILGNEITKGCFIDFKKEKEKIIELSKQYGLAVNLSAKISQTTVSQQQRIEILKVLYRGADILIFDEPTAVLTPQEITEFIKVIKGLVHEGKSIIFITHKLKEIKEACDRVTVIRRGKSIGTIDTSATTDQQLADMMVGRKVNLNVTKPSSNIGDTILDVENLVVKDSRG
ncbi:MAG: ATP-binding cassette domain-containing protein, partial [Lactobacillus iners]|nr:ATP-binding cassette domain-containing protein [Lactobacillus iners]